MSEYKCEECGRIFKHKENLTYHKKYTHSGIKRKYNIVHKKPKIICPKCEKSISVCVIKKHLNSCKGKIEQNYKIVNNKYICLICNKEYSKFGIKTHIWRCHSDRGKLFDPNRGYKEGTRVGWNKGHTKENDSRILKSIITFKNNHKLGKHKKAIAKDKESWKKNISISINKAVQNNPSSYNGHYNRGLVKEYNYNGIKLLGTWELKFAIWCDKNNIKWVKNQDCFEYFYLNKTHQYFPDFYLPEFNEYIEIKGYKTVRDIFKWKQFPNNKKLNILFFDKLKTLGILNIISDEDILRFKAP